MDMKFRTIRDGIVLVGAFHYLMALLSFIGATAIFFYLVLPPINAKAENLTQQIFFPAVGAVVGLLLSVVYVVVGTNLMRFSNSARMTAIFLSVVGLLSGFAGVIGSIIIRMGGPTLPNLVSVILIAGITICVYTLLAFLDIFVLLFLFNRQVRGVFYKEPWAAAEETPETPTA